MNVQMGEFQRFGIENDWYERLHDQFTADYFAQLETFVNEERKHHEVFPSPNNVFEALNATPFHHTRIVILGQDPYHGPQQAHGLCFSVQRDTAIPPSLANIFTELEHDIGVTRPTHGCLTKWAQQGVLLLNTTLTVRRGEPGSHHGKGWERFTDRIISLVNAKTDPVAFVLWGNPARKKKTLITGAHHRVIEAPHPSPLSAHRGFFGSRPFSTVNEFLAQHGYPLIDWTLND